MSSISNRPPVAPAPLAPAPVANGAGDVATAREQALNRAMPKIPGNLDVAGAEKAAKEFEAMFLSQMLQPIFDTVKSDKGSFGGGQGEATFKAFMVEEYGKIIANSGGVGIAKDVKAQILRMQEAANKAKEEAGSITIPLARTPYAKPTDQG